MSDENNSGEEGHQQPSGDDRVTELESKFETRLSQMASQLSQLTEGQKTEKLKRDLSQYEQALTTKVTDGEQGVAKAEAALAAAVDEGDGGTVAKAQRALAEAVADHREAQMALNGYKARVREAEKRDGGARSAGAEPAQQDNDATNLNAWKSRNAEWYGVDTDMTKAAHKIDEQIRAAGAIPVGSKQYFEAIDRQMRQQYPNKLGGAPQTAGGSTQQQPGPRRGRIPQAVAETWRKMGIKVDDPKVVDRMLKHRATAVEKGILPSEMVTGQVRT